MLNVKRSVKRVHFRTQYSSGFTVSLSVYQRGLLTCPRRRSVSDGALTPRHAVTVMRFRCEAENRIQSRFTKHVAAK